MSGSVCPLTNRVRVICASPRCARATVLRFDLSYESCARGVGNNRSTSIVRLLPCGAGRPSDAFCRTDHSSHHSTVLFAPMSFTAGVGRSVSSVSPAVLTARDNGIVATFPSR